MQAPTARTGATKASVHWLIDIFGQWGATEQTAQFPQRCLKKEECRVDFPVVSFITAQLQKEAEEEKNSVDPRLTSRMWLN